MTEWEKEYNRNCRKQQIAGTIIGSAGNAMVNWPIHFSLENLDTIPLKPFIILDTLATRVLPAISGADPNLLFGTYNADHTFQPLFTPLQAVGSGLFAIGTMLLISSAISYRTAEKMEDTRERITGYIRRRTHQRLFF